MKNNNNNKDNHFMKKNKFFKQLLLGGLLLAVVLLTNCTDDPPTGGDGGGGGDTPNFSVKNEYIDFHSYYGEVENLSGSTLNNTTLVVSTSATPKAIGDIHNSAKIIRKFDTNTLKTRKIYIGWTDEYSTNKYRTFRNTLPTNGASSYSHLVTEESHYNNIPWIMKANNQYYLHIYYNDGTSDKTFTKAFKTPDYPSTAQEAEDMFRGNMVASALFNTGLSSIERKIGEPIVNSLAVSIKVDQNIALSMEDTGNVLAQYAPSVGFIAANYDYVFLKFGDDPKLLYHATPSNLFAVLMIGHQTGVSGETANRYTIDFGANSIVRTVTLTIE